MDGLAAVLAPDPGVESPRLVVGRVRDRRHLAIAIVAREPDLDVVGLRGGLRHVACREDDDAVREPQLGHDLLGVGEQELVLVPRLLGQREAELLNLVELVDAEHASRVASGGSRLAAKAG